MSLINIGTRALQANQLALQVAGNNIANVNTPGYSRQNVVMQNLPGQYTGSGFIGKGVDVKTIERKLDEYLTRQSNIASTNYSLDKTRSEKFKQLEAIFERGPNGLGAAVSDMMNAFADVAATPTDLTARSVTLTRLDEAASRFLAASQRMSDLQNTVELEATNKVDLVNDLAKGIADINIQISRTNGIGQPPNDLLDRRDQMVREMNQYVKTTSIMATDGTLGVFLANSQPLVLNNTAAVLSLQADEFGDKSQKKLVITRNKVDFTLQESALGGGEIAGLLRFQNTDITEASNLLGRMAVTITTELNNQHKLGLDLDGNIGTDLLKPIVFGGENILSPKANTNTTGLQLGLEISDASKLTPSDYLINFDTATTGKVIRQSDGKSFSFPTTGATAPLLAEVDGLKFSISSIGVIPATGDHFLIKPFNTASSNMSSLFSTPRALAVASPVVGAMGTANTGSLQQTSLKALTNASSVLTPVTITFNSASTFTRSDVAGTSSYLPGLAISSADWELVLQGAPKTGDTFTIYDIQDTAVNADFKFNSGNATAMMNLRDKALFDNATLTDGYASLISQVGVRAQSATYTAEVSGNISQNLESARSGVSGVNLDEEAANLLRFQQAYQASSKMIQISQTLFDNLMQSVGR
jgi:flagellar hook-associated protein 1 FlgK